MIEPDRIALAVQQPWADLIVRGVKTIEVRSTAARPRGRIYIYASRKLSELPDATIAAQRHDLDIAALPRGLIVGTAELVACRPAAVTDASAALVSAKRLSGRIAWQFTNAARFERPLEPRFVPYGIWFYPFQRR